MSALTQNGTRFVLGAYGWEESERGFVSCSSNAEAQGKFFFSTSKRCNIDDEFDISNTLHINMPTFVSSHDTWIVLILLCYQPRKITHIWVILPTSDTSFETIVIPHFPRFGITISGKGIPRKACTES